MNVRTVMARRERERLMAVKEEEKEEEGKENSNAGGKEKKGLSSLTPPLGGPCCNRPPVSRSMMATTIHSMTLRSRSQPAVATDHVRPCFRSSTGHAIQGID
jgi:hypothetical protein